MKSEIKLQLLSNRPKVKINAVDIHIPDSSLDLLIYLTVENQAEYDRDRLTLRLYESLEFRDSLRQTALGNLPRAIKDLCIQTSRQTINFDNTLVRVDALEFQTLAHGISEEHSTLAFKQTVPQLVQACELYQNNLLNDYTPTLYGLHSWLKEKQITLRTLFHRILEKLIQYEIATQNYSAALIYAERWHRNDLDANLPLQYLIWLTATVDAHSLMLAYLESLEQIDTARTVIIGYSPAEWRRVVERGIKPDASVLRLTATARIEVQELLDRTQNHLFGREAAFEQVVDALFISQSTSVLTVTGERGIGKTTFGQSVAKACEDSELIEQAIHIGVTLATDFDQILNTIANELGQPHFLELDYRTKYLNIEDLLKENDYLLILDQQEVGDVYSADLRTGIVALSENIPVMVCAHETWEDVPNVPLKPLTDHDAADMLTSFLGDDQDLPSDFSALMAATRGIPLILKLLANSTRANKLSIDDLSAQLQQTNQQFLYWCWEMLDTPARRVLASLTDFDLLEGPTLADLQQLHADLPQSTVATAAQRLEAMALIESVKGQYLWHSLVQDFLQEIDALAAVDGPQLKALLREAFCTLHFAYLARYAHDHPHLDAQQRNLLHAFEIAVEQGTMTIVDVNRFAPYLLVRGLYQRARELLTQAEQVVSNPNPNEQIELLVNTAKLDIRQGEYQAGEMRLSQALALAEEYNQLQYLGEIYQPWGIIAKTTGRYDLALKLNQKTLAFARGREDLELISTTLANLGMTTLERGKHKTAKLYLEESLEIAQTIRQPKIIEFTYNALGIIANEELKFDKALDYLTRAQLVAHSLGRLERLGYIFLNTGCAHYYLEQYKIAEDNFNQGLEIANRLGHEDLRARITRNLGRIEAVKGNFLHAEQLYNEVLVDFGKLETTTFHASIFLDLGKLFFQQHLNTQARNCFQAALEQALELHSFDLVAEAVLGLGFVTTADYWIIGPDNPHKTVELLKNDWEPQLRAQLLQWPITANDLRKATFLFEYGLVNFPGIQRYRVVEALTTLMGLTEI